MDKEVDLRVVGIHVGDNLRIVTSLDTLRQQLGMDLDPIDFRIKVASGADPETVQVALLRRANDLLSVTVFDEYEGSRKTAGYIRPPLYALTLALLAIAVVSVLITLLFAVRERYREFAILKTLGFTPRQIAVSVVSGSILLAGIVLVAGIPLGLMFTRLALNLLGSGADLGTPFGTMPGPLELMFLTPSILLVAVLGSFLPARRAAGITVTKALRFA